MPRLILNSQKKIIFELMQKIELDPTNFEWGTVKSNYGDYFVSILRYKGNSFFFKFDTNLQNQDRYTYSPASDKSQDTAYPNSWNINYILEWLNSLKREIDIVDPWDEIEKYIPGAKVNLEDEKANEPFSFTQVTHITESLSKLKAEISKNYKLTGEQVEIVQNKLDYLIDRAKKIGRIDWKNIFVATIIQIALELSLNPEQTQLLWSFVKSCFKGFLLIGIK